MLNQISLVTHSSEVKIWESAVDEQLDFLFVALHRGQNHGKVFCQPHVEEAAEYEFVPKLTGCDAQQTRQGWYGTAIIHQWYVGKRRSVLSLGCTTTCEQVKTAYKDTVAAKPGV